MARKPISVFNLSFLDIMSCGFGAVILVFMIISAQVSVRADKENSELLGETNRLEEEILDGRKNLVRLNSRVDERRLRMSSLQEESARLQVMIDELKEQLNKLDKTSLASMQSIEQLEIDIDRLEEAKKRLLKDIKAQESDSGGSARAYVGEGNRQYLTGMKMDGKRILILVDASASMLGRTYIDAIIYRNMSDSQKLLTPKWRSAVDAVDWITTRIPRESEFQIVAFNALPWSVVDAPLGKWVSVEDGKKLNAAISRLRTTVPQKGTSLYNVFNMVRNMDRKPDNIYLLTDGLPTQGKSAPYEEELIKPERRIKFFKQAVARLPGRIPVNILLYPMNGDPDAAGYLWRLAVDSRGSFMTPSQDWP